MLLLLDYLLLDDQIFFDNSINSLYSSPPVVIVCSASRYVSLCLLSTIVGTISNEFISRE